MPNLEDISPGMLADELESGRWKKGANRLKTTFNDISKHCCIGVLCEMADNVSFTPDGTATFSSGHKSNVSVPISAGNHLWLYNKRRALPDKKLHAAQDGHYLIVQGLLTSMNDADTNWNSVIKYLRQLQAEIDQGEKVDV